MTETAKLPRLGDRADLRIDITPAAAASYVQTYAAAFAGPGPRAGLHFGARLRTITPAAARAELLVVLRDSSVAFSSGERMQVRGRVRRLEVDVLSDCTRLAPDHIRCNLAEVRRIDKRTARAGSRTSTPEAPTRRVYDLHGRRVGFVRVTIATHAVEYRPVAEENGAPAPPWGPLPEHVRLIATRDEQLAAWLRKNGIA